MQKNLFSCLILLLLLTTGCHPSNEFPKKYRGEQIQFGQGGGFSGAVTQFVLLEDGRLFQLPWRDSTKTYIGQWEKNFTKQIFQNYKVLNLEKLTYNEPGDLYYFIDYQTDENVHHRIVWGKPGFHPEENLISYYNLLFRSSKPKS